MNISRKTLVVSIAVGLVVVMLFCVFSPPGERVSIAYTDFLGMVESRSVIQVTLQGDNLSGLSAQGPFQTFAPKDPELIRLLRNKGVKISAEPLEGPSWLGMFLSWFPMLLLIGVWIFFMRRMQGGGGNPLSLGKSQAKLMSDSQKKVTFEDVAGIDEAREELKEIVDFLRDPLKFTRLGGRIPKGVLLVGVPGTGKTLLARAIAGVAGVPFFTISGSNFVEMFTVGGDFRPQGPHLWRRSVRRFWTNGGASSRRTAASNRYLAGSPGHAGTRSSLDSNQRIGMIRPDNRDCAGVFRIDGRVRSRHIGEGSRAGKSTNWRG